MALHTFPLHSASKEELPTKKTSSRELTAKQDTFLERP